MEGRGELEMELDIWYGRDLDPFGVMMPKLRNYQ